MKDEQIDAVAKILKSMAHPIRLKILCLLQDKEMSVGDIRDQVETTNANVSQHLNILRSRGIIDFRKDANFSTWLYRISYNICLDQLRYEKKFQ